VKRAEEAEAQEEPVEKKPVIGAKWERWAKRLDWKSGRRERGRARRVITL
jgi:hypothetical protein